MGSHHPSAKRPDPDPLLVELAEYATAYQPSSDEAFRTARWCLLDSLGCAMLALNYEDCTKLLGPVVPGAVLPGGARVPGTNFELDPVQAAFNIGATIRWLDFNDTWLAAEWGHPSDNLGAILAVADYLDRQAAAAGHSEGVELRVLALHGLLHLLGYDHERDDGRMRRLEQRLRRKGGLREGLIERRR